MATAAKFFITLGLGTDGTGSWEEFIISRPLPVARMDKKKQNMNWFMECFKTDGATASTRAAKDTMNRYINPLWTSLRVGF
jgi:hypothetical protein